MDAKKIEMTVVLLVAPRVEESVTSLAANMAVVKVETMVDLKVVVMVDMMAYL